MRRPEVESNSVADSPRQVYPAAELPEGLDAAEINQCRWSQYSSELFLHSILTSTPSISNLYLTTDPTQASHFLVPLFPACYLFNCWVASGWNQTKRCEVDERYVEPTMRAVREKWPFWNASNGADHLLFHPMDRVDEYYSEASRRAMRNATYLTTLGDLRSPAFRNASWYRPYQDIVVPSATHLLHSYYVHPMDYLSADGYPFSVTPASSPDPPAAQPTVLDIYSPSPHFRKLSRSWFRSSSRRPVVSRSTLAIFRGGGADSYPLDPYARGVRSLFFPSSSSKGFASLSSFSIATSSPSNEAYAASLATSKFGLTPPGYTLDTTRLWEYLAFGVVPVFIGVEPLVLPFSSSVDWSSLSISIPRSKAHLTPQILRAVTSEEYEEKRRAVWEVGRGLVIEGKKGMVWHYLARELCAKKPELAEHPTYGKQTIVIPGYRPPSG